MCTALLCYRLLDPDHVSFEILHADKGNFGLKIGAGNDSFMTIKTCVVYETC